MERMVTLLEFNIMFPRILSYSENKCRDLVMKSKDVNRQLNDTPCISFPIEKGSWGKTVPSCK